jgi:hypothetical protein
MIYDNNQTELFLIALNLVDDLKDSTFEANQDAEFHLDDLVYFINEFINSPEQSYVNLFWVTKIIEFYSKIDCFEVSNIFFQSINLNQLPKFYQAEGISFFYAFLQQVVHYFDQCYQHEGYTNRLDKIISNFFEEISLEKYANFINNYWLQKLERVSSPEYNSTDEINLSSVISGIVLLFYRAFNCVDDKDIKNAISSQVDVLFNKLDFKILGKLLEAQRKKIGPILKLIDAFAKSKQYLFSWEEVPGNDNERLIEFLKQNFGIGWVKKSKIEKINDRTIRISSEINYLLLRLNVDKKKVYLKIDGFRTEEFSAETENGKLNIYIKIKKDLIRPMIAELNFLRLARAYNDQEFLFCWDNILDDAEKLQEYAKGLLDYLRDNKFGRTNGAAIRKSDDDKSISIITHTNSAEIMIDERKEHATLKFNDGRIHKLTVKKENGNFNVYGVIGCARLAKFCNVYSYTKQLESEWKDFLKILDFNKCYYQRGGLNFADTSMILLNLIKLFKNDRYGLAKILNRFDFKQIGSISRDKNEKKLNYLFERLIRANLTEAQYCDFIDGFGGEECKRLANNRNLLGLLKRCNYSNGELEQLGIIAIF